LGIRLLVSLQHNGNLMKLVSKKESDRKYYLKNKDKIKATVKEWCENNKEHIKKYRREHFQKNKEEISEKNIAYRIANSEKIRKQRKKYRDKLDKVKVKIYMDNYYKKHKEKIKKQKLLYYYDNQEKILLGRKTWHQKNLAKSRAIRNKYKPKTIEQKLIHNMRCRVYDYFKYNKSIKDIRTLELLECSIKFLKQYIQKRFKKGMTWDNYGEWHIDHIIPIDYFLKKCNFNSLRIQKKCFNYKNLRPMWAVDNLRKGAKLI
jgi:hypothetical protein